MADDGYGVVGEKIEIHTYHTVSLWHKYYW
jgi:hypothetical protein